MKLNKNGYISASVAAGFLVVVALSLSVLSVWLFMRYTTVRDTVNQQIEVAVADAKVEQKQADDAAFAETLKQPYRTYKAPEVYGSISVSFPKNWNVYTEEEQGSSLEVYMHPLAVVKKSQNPPSYALRLQLVDTLYTNQMQAYSSAVEEGALKAKSITVSGIAGTRYDGKLEETSGTRGSLVVLPIRDKTLVVWTEDEAYLKDFNNILAKLKLAP